MTDTVLPSGTTSLLLTLVEQGFDHRSWHGTNLLGSLRRVDPVDAAWRPGPQRHNVWELLVHAAYWKYTVVRRLTGGKRGSFPLAGSNFFTRPAPGVGRSGFERAWKDDLVLLRETHASLLAAIHAFPDERWEERAPKSPFLFRELVSGIAAHDLYHAGQIQLLKRLRAARR